MATVSFTEWAAPDLVLQLGGGTYTVPPPSVAQAPQLLACCARAEVNLGLALGPVPEELEVLLQGLDDTPLGHISLTPKVYEQMVADGVAKTTLDRMAYYAMFYWARGKVLADALAEKLWTPRAADIEDAGDSPGEA